MFRFTIRDVLWLMVVVGLALGWGMGLQRESARRKRAEWQLDAIVQLMNQHGYISEVTPNHVQIYRRGVHWIVLPDGSMQKRGESLGSE